jgi:hypothetical protein
MATSFNGGRSQNTRKEPPTMGKRLVSLIMEIQIEDKDLSKINFS